MSGSGSHGDLPPAVVEGGQQRPRHFRLHGLVGRGGPGEVYRATMWREGGLQSEVAVKFLSEGLGPDSEAVRRLAEVTRRLGSLHHPVILDVVDIVVLEGRVALVTDHVQGEDLSDAIHTGGLPLRALVEAVGAVADALHVAWSLPGPDGRPSELVHGDVKPRNIRIGIHGQVKLLDFGIGQTSGETGVGNGGCLPPERLTDNGPPLTAKVDVWGLGCVLYEGLAGEPLIEGRTLADMVALGNDPVAFQRLIRDRLAALDVSSRVSGLLAPMLAIDPELRPTMAEIAHACDELTESVPGAGLLRWARTRSFDTEPPEGPLSSKQLVADAATVPPVARTTPPVRQPSDPTPLSDAAIAHSQPFGVPSPVVAPPGVDIAIGELGELRAPRRPERGVHAAWWLIGLGLLFAVAVVAVGIVVVGGMPRTVELPRFPEPADEEGLLPIAPPPARIPVPPGEAAVEPVPEPAPAPARPRRPKRRPAPPLAPLDPRAPLDRSATGPAELRARGATVELRGEFGDFRPGTPLVVGDYEVWADLGGGLADTGLRTRVVGGGVVEVSCDREQQKCFVRPELPR